MLALGLVACVSGAGTLPSPELEPPVTTTGATLPAYFLSTHPELRVGVRAPASAPYRVSILGSDPQTVELTLGNAGRAPLDVDDVRVSFEVRRGATRIPCAARTVLPTHEVPTLGPGRTTTLARELCALPLPGEYSVDVLLALARDARPARAGSFSFVVRPVGRNVPRAVPDEPGLFAALGGDTTGVRFTRPEWKAGAYHVVVRLTNAGTNAIALPPSQVVFRVTKHGHPLACTAMHAIALPAALASGESVARSVPVTCLIDVQGQYDIHASLATSDAETHLADLSVQVTSDPLLYLPIIPW